MKKKHNRSIPHGGQKSSEKLVFFGVRGAWGILQKCLSVGSACLLVFSAFVSCSSDASIEDGVDGQIEDGYVADGHVEDAEVLVENDGGDEPNEGEKHEALDLIGQTMNPGEWRYVETENTPSFRTAFCPLDDPDAGSTYALGWTDYFVYDSATQSFWALGMRETSEKRLFFMDKNLVWNDLRVSADECRRDRRPFNRLTTADGYLYWPSSNTLDDGGDNSRGHLLRAPVSAFLNGETDVTWDVFSPGLGIGNMNSTGDFAVEHFPEMGGWVFFGRRSGSREPIPFSQEGHTEEGESLQKSWFAQVRFFKPGDNEWTFFDRTYSAQYAGRLLYNPLKKEVLIAPGNEFSSHEEQDAPLQEWAVITAEGGDNDLVEYGGDGPIPRVKKLDRQVGLDDELPNYTPRYSNLTYHPATGDYIWWHRGEEKMWTSGDGKHWSLYEDFENLEPPLFPETVSKFMGSGGLFGASGYIQMNPVPGTDLLIFFDPYRGVILHRLKY